MLCGYLTRNRSSPSGTTPQSANADSSPFRGAIGADGYNICCRKPMPPLKGRGGPPLGGGEVRPRRQRLPIPQPTHTQQNPQGRIPGGLVFKRNPSQRRLISRNYLLCCGSSVRESKTIDVGDRHRELILRLKGIASVNLHKTSVSIGLRTNRSQSILCAGIRRAIADDAEGAIPD